MYVDISDAEHAAICDPANLRELRVKTHGVCEAEVESALASSGLGSLDGEHAWLSIAKLKEAGTGFGCEWAGNFAGMVTYADSQGWLSPDRLSVRAHLERS